MSDVSVIIPVKNRAGLLRQTLDNLLQQTCKPSEIIVVDDHSTDDISLVIYDYITECIFLNNKGVGPGAARNLGLSAATGRYIQFFDSDDLMTPGKIAAQREALERTGADMAYGPYQPARLENGRWIPTDVMMQWEPFDPALPLPDHMLRGWNAITQACLFRREAIDRCPLWDERLITHEDYLYLFRFSLTGGGAVHVPGEGVLYRRHGEQSTGDATAALSRTRDKLSVLCTLKTEMEKAGAGFLSRGLFRGRLAQTYNYYRNLGADTRPFSGYMSPVDFFWENVYRLYNHSMRRRTGTGWEPMHGINRDPVLIQSFLDLFSYV